MHFVHSFNIFRGHYFHSSEGIYARILEEQKTVTISDRQIEIVQNSNDTDIILLSNFTNRLHNFMLVARIKVTGWLIQ